MKFAFLPLLAACAFGLAVASPIRVVVVSSSVSSSNQDVTRPNVRLGHAAASANANIVTPSGPCPGKLMRDKAISISNAFRKALGFPLIETEPSSSSVNPKGYDHSGIVHIRPLPFIGTPIMPDDEERHVAYPHPHHAHHVKHHHHHHNNASFLWRVHHALMALGPWEGRAVAFVLGCGIGVLLRMFWVMAVVVYRMIKGDSGEDEGGAHEYTLVCEHYADAEAVEVPPPSYILEKDVDGDVKA